MQTDPNQGYLATSEYIYAYFRQQHPASLRWVQLLAGFKTPSASADALHMPLVSVTWGRDIDLRE
ncbi:MAG TPA: hypothetical protein PK283_06835, partial [Thiotrichales bacterium]|nr:hypothetical protein [Thiotrichales bacterium]